MTNVVVTGAAGYLGSVLVEALLDAQDYHVIAVDNFSHGVPSLSHLCHSHNLTIECGDARDMQFMSPLLARADYFIPLAAIVGAPACNKDRYGAHSINVGAVQHALLKLSKGQRVIIPITNSGYGIGGDAECTEESPLKPISFYGTTKVAAERVVLDRGNAVSLRLATVFGMSPRMRLDLLVNDFTYRAVHDHALTLFEPHFRRNYIHVRDVARAFLLAMDRFDDLVGSPIYNVGLSNANLTKLELCERIRKWVPNFVFLESPIGEDPDKRDYVVSNAKIEAAGWRPVWSLDAGILELIKGFKGMRRPFSNV